MTDEALSDVAAANALALELSERTSQEWQAWLRNNRNQSRSVPYRVEFVRVSNRPFYTRAALESFVDWEKSRQLGTLKVSGRAAEVMRAFGIGTTAGSSTGRAFNVTSVSSQVDQVTGSPFVQMLTTNPLMVYRLEPDQAIRLGNELTEIGQAAERVAKRADEQRPDTDSYQTVTDNHDMKIMRRNDK